MGIGLRRISTCLRVCALVTAGIGVAHGSAIRANATEQAGQAAEPTGSIALPEEKAPSDAAGLVGEQRAAKAARTLLPANRMASLTQKGLAAGDAVMIRIFKAESELELWMQKDDRFELFTTYSICKWSGKLGPKQHEGDRQAPEGMYAVGMPQIHRKGRWPRALNIGYPNAFDRAMDRTGSYILVHGGCSSTGCFAMTNQQMEEIYRLSEEALKQGQTHIPIHVFPFRMTETNLKAFADSRWQSFWRNLKDAY
ncbi:MAG: L,D-transpeptidase family protein, partial [Hyphomicrobiaceae bacterium]